MKHDDELVEQIYKVWAEGRKDQRMHLGASQIGKECDRAIWYGWRWYKTEVFDGRMIRLFDRGQREEGIIMGDLMACGMDVEYDIRKQPTFSDLGGHLGGSCDGIGKLGKHRFLIECKTANEKSWKDLHKKGVQESKPDHYCQMQMYMGQFEIHKCLYISVNKNDDQIHAEWVDFYKSVFTDLRQRAKEIIFSNDPPDRISENPADYRCKMCSYWGLCHEGGEDTPDRNCRTCLFSEAREDGYWFCNKHMRTLDKAAQVAGCEDWNDLEEVPF